MSAPIVQGWCPGAHRPMMSGDGLVVRVRPRLARLDARQALGLCELAGRFGNGTIDLTNRANLQLRGVQEANHQSLLAELAALNLLDAEPDIEVRRNILVSPLYQTGDLTARLAQELIARLAELPDLPAKFGFAIDTGPARLLAEDSADIRLESCPDGLILRADGAKPGAVCPRLMPLTNCSRWRAGLRSATRPRPAAWRGSWRRVVCPVNGKASPPARLAQRFNPAPARRARSMVRPSGNCLHVISAN